MNKRTDNERLLEDVLAGELEDGFHAASLDHVLRLARRRRRTRITQRVSVVATALLVSAIVGVRYFAPKQIKSEVAQTPLPAASFAWVTTRPLSPDEIVTSRPLLPEQTITSLEMTSFVHTVSGNYREVGDDELLALAAPQVVALVRRGPHEAELLFVSSPTEPRTN
jgi:hypothetical protein